MAYATTDFYRDTYQGRACADDTTLEKWLTRASDDLDILTMGQIDITTLSAAALIYLQKACCAQAENFVINGDESGGVESFSLGAFSIKESKDSGSDIMFCERASRFLFLAGLSFRGVGVVDRSARCI